MKQLATIAILTLATGGTLFLASCGGGCDTEIRTTHPDGSVTQTCVEHNR